MAITDILPDPYHPINTAGEADVLGVLGPGFESLKLSSKQPLVGSRVNSKRSEKDIGFYHTWLVDVSYNELTCDEFHLIFSFINFRESSLTPFYISVPPYSTQNLTAIDTAAAYNKGDSTMLVDGTGIEPGFLFNVGGTTKAYQVTRVETNTLFGDNQPGVGQEFIHFTPGLVEDIIENTAVIFDDPLIRVSLSSASSSYNITTDGLFNYSISLEEVRQ